MLFKKNMVSLKLHTFPYFALYLTAYDIYFKKWLTTPTKLLTFFLLNGRVLLIVLEILIAGIVNLLSCIYTKYLLMSHIVIFYIAVVTYHLISGRKKCSTNYYELKAR